MILFNSRQQQRSSLLLAGAALLWGLASSAQAEPEPTAEDIEAGRIIAADRKRGNCYSCHQVEGVELAGNVGPPLVYMQLRYPDRNELEAQIADPRKRNPASVMPPYGAHQILTPKELNLVTEYVLSL